MTYPHVSVVLPVRNRAAILPLAVQSVLNQTYGDIDIVIVDDASDDETPEIAESLAASFPVVSVVRLEHQLGASGARNVGIRHITGSLVAFQDSDDEWLPTKLEKQVAALLEAGEACGACFCRLERKSRRTVEVVPPEIDASCFRGRIVGRLLRSNAVGTPTLLVRRDVLERVGGFDEALRSLEDWDIALRIASSTSFAFVDEVLVRAHRGPGTVNGLATPDVMGVVLAKHVRAVADAERRDAAVGYLNVALRSARLGKTVQAMRFLGLALKASGSLVEVARAAGSELTRRLR